MYIRAFLPLLIVQREKNTIGTIMYIFQHYFDLAEEDIGS